MTRVSAVLIILVNFVTLSLISGGIAGEYFFQHPMPEEITVLAPTEMKPVGASDDARVWVAIK